ncbi:uncharacterized protein LOC106136867 [Amyelois transitella]|uniref:uncharacterized protein LOC106136867 n=1 Tax=Amyelois transitella TaxID=680683 RepID=UPI00067BCA99|nr:uncharacterized protein LOC106136867 [Amyelois transitella]
MATLEDEIRDLKEKNNELVQKVQYWKVAAANKEDEKLELMKEINELRLKLSRLRSGGAAQARKLDTALQSTSEEALTHLVKASSAVARTIELAKTYMQERQELQTASPRWSAIGGTPSSDRVHRVPPMLIGGQSIQPVVSLSRTLMNTSVNPHAPSRTIVLSRSPQQNRNVAERAVPVRMLQDVYIPLTRIDLPETHSNNMETDTENNELDNSEDNLNLEDSGERSLEESQNMSDGDDFESSRRLEAVAEDLEPEDIDETPPRSRTDNPLEGPSWLLDRPTNARTRARTGKSKSNLEPDSTTQLDENSANAATALAVNDDEPSAPPAAFSPTVRRRRRASSPPRNSNSGRVLKVLVAKMRLDSGSDGDDVTPPKRPTLSENKRLSRDSSPGKRLMEFDAPSPNGATDARVIVLERTKTQERGSGEPTSVTAGRRDSRHARPDCGDGRDPSLGDGNRTRADKRSRTDRVSNNDSLIVDNDSLTVNNDSLTVNNDSDSEVMISVLHRAGTSRAELRISEYLGDGVDEMMVVSHRGGQSRAGGSRSDDRIGSFTGDVSDMGRLENVSRDSDSSTEQVREGRTRRPRKQVVYKEKPLNRKMRR